MYSTGRSFLLKLCLGDHLLSPPSSKTFLRQKCLTAPSSQVLAGFQEACQAFGQTVKGVLSFLTSNATHQAQSGGLVWIKSIREPVWTGPYPVFSPPQLLSRKLVSSIENRSLRTRQMSCHLDLEPLKDKTDESLLTWDTKSPNLVIGIWKK